MSKIVAADSIGLGAGASAQEILPLSVDPTTLTGVAAPVGSIGLLATGGAGSLYVKTGAANTAWSLMLAKSASQTFIYTATGSEGSSFTVTIPVAMASAAYTVQATSETVASLLVYSTPLTGRIAASFPVITSASLTAGDTIQFTCQLT